jgi:hypothetical protein
MLRIYAKCVAGQDELVKHRTSEAQREGQLGHVLGTATCTWRPEARIEPRTETTRQDDDGLAYPLVSRLEVGPSDSGTGGL